MLSAERKLLALDEDLIPVRGDTHLRFGVPSVNKTTNLLSDRLNQALSHLVAIAASEMALRRLPSSICAEQRVPRVTLIRTAKKS